MNAQEFVDSVKGAANGILVVKNGDAYWAVQRVVEQNGALIIILGGNVLLDDVQGVGSAENIVTEDTETNKTTTASDEVA